ncbi:hypothetical protein EYF80_061802 [Liparis tanakae]|uniref:Uncharacterized protein n=1 Tax=Liparis tanakae TaxID=230148 RepID=A0A4Z2EHL5_9TELE|nr:hypothetical protein EYF80_061802 [Liparis tanakae]
MFYPSRLCGRGRTDALCQMQRKIPPDYEIRAQALAARWRANHRNSMRLQPPSRPAGPDTMRPLSSVLHRMDGHTAVCSLHLSSSSSDPSLEVCLASHSLFSPSLCFAHCAQTSKELHREKSEIPLADGKQEEQYASLFQSEETPTRLCFVVGLRVSSSGEEQLQEIRGTVRACQYGTFSRRHICVAHMTREHFSRQATTCTTGSPHVFSGRGRRAFDLPPRRRQLAARRAWRQRSSGGVTDADRPARLLWKERV